MGIELTRCLDADECDQSVKCLRATLPGDKESQYARFLNPKFGPCWYFASAELIGFIKGFEGQA